MAERQTSAMRNLAFVGPSGAGKTALAEALSRAGTGRQTVTEAPLEVDPEEREFGHSLFPKMHRFDAQGVHINLIDTPGVADLVGPGIACLAAVETVVVVIAAHRGIEPVARQMMEFARVRKQPRVIVINGIDRPHLDLKGLLEELRSTFGPECLPINLPAQYGRSVEDCLENGLGTSDLGSVAEAHRRILDQVVELDETLMERYLAGTEPDFAALHATFERALDEAHVIPICFTSAREGVGVRELLAVIARQFPSPLEGNPRPFVSGKPGAETAFPYVNDPGRPLLAHVFRLMNDPILGTMALFRVHQGTAHDHRDVFLGESKKSVRVGHLMEINGRHHHDVHSVVAGDIGAVAKIEGLHIGHVLHEGHALDTVHLVPPPFPEPSYNLIFAPKSRKDEGKLAHLLQQLIDEDPTLQLVRGGESPLVRGLSELHLRVVADRIRHRGLVIETRVPTA